MLKKLFAVSLIALPLFFISTIDIDAKQTDCEHYFRTETIGDQRFLIEYSCDGSIVNITEIYE